MKKNLIILLSLSTISLSLIISSNNIRRPQEANPTYGFFPTGLPTPSPTPFNPFPYEPPELPRLSSYRLILVGDSIMGSLGPNAQLLRQHLIEYYPENEFVNYNYGFGATSIETLPDRLVNETEYNGERFPSILSQYFELIIIESFAYNPLSQEKEGEGIVKHILILDESIRKIIKEKPESVVAIMTPIAPSRNLFAKGVYELSSEERRKWADERINYIESVINYAQNNEIPLINVYEKSLSPQGDGDLKYINPDDYIHPSAEGVDLISLAIAEFIFNNKIFPE